MQAIIVASFQNMLLSLVQLAIGCLFPFIAGKLRNKGIVFSVDSPAGRIGAMAACSLMGMALPLGPFGLIPVAAGLWIAGLDLPCAMALLVSGFLFNSIEPITAPVFVWGGSVIRIAAALLLGVLAGVILHARKLDESAFFRPVAFQRLFAGPVRGAGYFVILHDYVEAAGLFVVAGAALNACLSGGAAYWLQNVFFSSDMGLNTITAIARFDVFNPFFTTALQVLGRLVDFMLLASAALLLRARWAALLYAYYLAAALLLSVGLFF